MEKVGNSLEFYDYVRRNKLQVSAYVRNLGVGMISNPSSENHIRKWS